MINISDFLVDLLDITGNLIFQRFDHGKFLANRLELNLMEVTDLFKEESLKGIKSALEGVSRWGLDGLRLVSVRQAGSGLWCLELKLLHFCS